LILPTILIVDDDLAAREVLQESLQAADYDCDSAASAAEALAKLERRQYHLILTDVVMPGQDGVDLLRAVKGRDPDIDVVMVTGIVDVSTAIEAIRLGASDYVTKPFNIEEVKIIVERTWEKRQLINENRAYQENLELKVTERTGELLTAYREIEQTYRSTLEALIQALDLRDTETQGHSMRVVEYAVELARRLRVPEQDLVEIRRGALLHDIGKIGIPDAILRKPGKLDASEWEIMRRHPELGYNILAGVHFLEQAREIVLSHQEWYDGNGYPRRLRGDGIPLGARVFAVADTLDAMMSTRPYRPGLPYEVARREIQDFSGRQFDPRVVGVFLASPHSLWEEIRGEVRRRIGRSDPSAIALGVITPVAPQ